MTDSTVPKVTVEMPYARTLGPVVGRFLSGLRAGEIWANTTVTGKVQCPPFEYDPMTGAAATGDWVQLSGVGTVRTWAWVDEPLRNHLLQKPFAWCLIRLDGADTDLLHAVDAGSRDRISCGTRVRVRWRNERIGHIKDIECFEPMQPTGEGS
jgi:uncharacterized OB-fold protein